MQIQTLLLDLFASLALISATMVIVSTNPIHSVVFLILVFCNAAGLLVLLRIEFIAMMFLIIYVGAIAVLFLFVVMMLNIKVNELSENWLRYLPIGGIISVIFFFEIAFFLILPLQDSASAFVGAPPHAFALIEAPQNVMAHAPEQQGNPLVELSMLYNDHFTSWDINQRNWSSLISPGGNIQSLGYLIYTYYFYYFLMASLILLIAMIGAIVLTMHKRKNASKKQLIFKQIARNFETAVAYVPKSIVSDK